MRIRNLLVLRLGLTALAAYPRAGAEKPFAAGRSVWPSARDAERNGLVEFRAGIDASGSASALLRAAGATPFRRVRLTARV